MSKITVDTTGNWKLYTNTLPANSTPLGTVTRDGFDTGALVRIESTGLYAHSPVSLHHLRPGNRPFNRT